MDPVAGIIFSRVSAGVRVMKGTIEARLKISNVVFAERQPNARSHKPRRSTVKVSLPVFFRPEDRAIIQANIFVNKDVAMVGQIRPDIPNAGFKGKLEVDVQKCKENGF